MFQNDVLNIFDICLVNSQKTLLFFSELKTKNKHQSVKL